MHCPNCAAELPGINDPACWNCEANFTHADGWRPVEKPDGEFRPFTKTRLREAPTEPTPPDGPSSLGMKILKACVAIPLLAIGGFFLILLPATGGWAILPTFLFMGAGIAVMASSADGSKVASISIGCVMLLLVFFALRILNGVTFAR